MLSKTRSTPVNSPAPGVVPDTVTGPVSNGSPVVTNPDVAPAHASAATERETGASAPAARPTGRDCTATRSWPSPWSRS